MVLCGNSRLNFVLLKTALPSATRLHKVFDSNQTMNVLKEYISSNRTEGNEVQAGYDYFRGL